MSTIAAAQTPASGTRVAKNFVWSTLENLLATLGVVVVTVAAARLIGPRRLGYFNYVYWLTTATGLIGSLGIPMTTGKYMAEFIGAGNHGLARRVFQHSFRIQVLISTAVSLVGLIIVLMWGDPEFRLISVFLVLSVIPQMLTYIPSKANEAAEILRANMMGSLYGEVVNIAGVIISLVFLPSGQKLLGIAFSVLLYRTTELIAKMIPVMRRLGLFETVPLPDELRKRMFTFSGLSTGLLLLQVTVWDRSDIFFLKILHSDIRQIAFFSISFSLADRLLRIPQAFGTALGATQMAEYGRDRQRLFRITSIAGTYIFMAALPMLLGAACLCRSIVSVIYGSQYFPAIPVFAIVAIFAIPKAVLAPAQSLLYSTEDLAFLLKWGTAAGILNIVLDLTLIPHFTARGAAFANGIAQAVCALGIWIRVLHRHPVRINMRVIAKVLLATTLMAAAVLGIEVTHLSNALKLVSGVAAGAVLFTLAIRFEQVFHIEDRTRLLNAVRIVPGRLRSLAALLVNFIAPLPSATQ